MLREPPSMPYLGRMTLLNDSPEAGRALEITIRHRLRIAREDSFPDMDKIVFATTVLGMGKNIATAYESKNGTREENMKDWVLRTWAEKCGVTFESLKFGVGTVHTGPEAPTTDYGAALSPVIELRTRFAA